VAAFLGNRDQPSKTVQAPRAKQSGLSWASRHRSSGSFQKGLDIAAAKALDSPDRMTRQFSPADHPVDGHRRQLQQFSELSDSIEFRLGVVSQSRSWHGFPLSLCIIINFRRYPLGIQRLCQAFPMLTIRILLTQSLGVTVIY